MLENGVREQDRVGNIAADEAADFSRRRVGHAVIDARRNLSGVCGRGYPVVLDLHTFFIAISWALFNHDWNGGTAPDPLVWSAGALPERRRLVHAVRDLAMLPGPPAIWTGDWVNGPVAVISAEDVAHWPHTPGLLVKWVVFFGSLHWPAGGADLGVGGISCVELLILYELWAGERLVLEKAHPRYLRPGRPISVPTVPFGPGIDIWRCCRFIGALMRFLCLLPGGRRFVLCSIGAHEKCGHGLTLRPRESASEVFLDELLLLFQCPPKSSRALVAGTLHLRYCTARFASKVPTWRLPVSGHAAGLVHAGVGAAGDSGTEVGAEEIRWVSGCGLGKRIRLNRKTPAHLVGRSSQSRPRVWKRLHCVGFSVFQVLIGRGGDAISMPTGLGLYIPGLG